jgi:hypothetical protein
MSEQLGFEERVGKAGAVHRDEPLWPPTAEVVNQARRDVFADSRFTFDQNGRVGSGSCLNIGAQSADERTISDENRLDRHLVNPPELTNVRARLEIVNHRLRYSKALALKIIRADPFVCQFAVFDPADSTK